MQLGGRQASGTTVASPLAARKMARYCGTSFTPGAKLNTSPRISILILFLRFMRTGSSVHARGTASRSGRNSSIWSRDIGTTWSPVLPCSEEGMRMRRLISEVTGSSVSTLPHGDLLSDVGERGSLLRREGGLLPSECVVCQREACFFLLRAII